MINQVSALGLIKLNNRLSKDHKLLYLKVYLALVQSRVDLIKNFILKQHLQALKVTLSRLKRAQRVRMRKTKSDLTAAQRKKINFSISCLQKIFLRFHPAHTIQKTM